MANIAQEAGVRYARTPQGYIVLNSDGSQSKPIEGVVLANALHDIATGAAAKRAAAEHDNWLKIQAEAAKRDGDTAGEIAVQSVKDAGAAALEKYKVQTAPGKLEFNPQDGTTYRLLPGGGLEQVIPGKPGGPGRPGTYPTLRSAGGIARAQ